MSACHLMCDAHVCLLLAGWNVIAPQADSDKWWCGAYAPLSAGMDLSTLTDKSRRCHKATGGLLLSLRPYRRGERARRVGSELLQELVSVSPGAGEAAWRWSGYWPRWF